MKKRFVLPVVITALFWIAVPQSNAAEETTTKKQEFSPFLIIGQLPHLTKVLMQQWDNPTLNLSAKQKEQLLVVRKETMGAVHKISPKAAELEKKIVAGCLAGKSPEELQPLVQALANYKAQASLVHLKCINDTRRILSPEQMKTLMAFGK